MYAHFILVLFTKILVCFQLISFANGSGIINADLPEEIELGSVVLKLRDRLPKKLASFADVEFRSLDQYLKLARSSRRSFRDIRPKTPWIVVETDSGILRQQTRVDREEMCGNAVECYIVIKVILSASEPAFRDIQTIHLHLKDINDNSPVFPHPSVDVSVSETAPINYEIDLDKDQAVDLDYGRNSSVTYSLLLPSEYFSVKEFRDRNNNSHLRLVVTKPLDFELDKIHRLTLRASDGGSPPRTASLPIQVAVKDENDNSPVFDKKRYEINLREDAPVGDIVKIVHASDEDRGEKGEVRYLIRVNLVDDQSNPAARIMRCPVIVNNQTGAVILRDKLNHKLHNGYKVIVEAIDGDETKPKIGKTLLVFHVEDVNDNYPEISVTFIVFSRGNTGYVSEDSPIGTYLAHVTALDADDGDYGDVAMSVETFLSNNQDDFENLTETGKFILNDENLLLTTISFDREKRSEYDVIIKAWDKGVPPKSSSSVIKIVILDVNEYAPVFQHPDLSITLPEDQEVGSVVYHASAIDRDSLNGPALRQSSNGEVEKSLNGKVIYGMTPAVIGDVNVKIPVAISPETGKITLVRSLDYESRQSWKLVITARDNGRPTALQSSCNLEIKVKNVNDNEPTFVNPAYDNSTVYVSITSESGAFITLKALDFGLNEKTSLRYSFRVLEKDDQVSNHLHSVFRLNRVSGEMSLNTKKISGEHLGYYKLKISVTDSGNPPQTSSMTLYVNVIEGPVPPQYQGILNRGDEDKSTNFFILIIGAGAGGLVIIIIIIIVAVIITRKRRQRKDQDDTENNGESDSLSKTSPPSDGSTALTAQTHCDAREPLQQEKDSDSKYNTTSTQKSNGRYRYCEVPNSSLDRKSFLHVKPVENQSSVKKSRSLSLDMPQRIPITGYAEVSTNRDYLLEMQERNCMMDMGKQCTNMCRILGHSDACWMPVEETSNPSMSHHFYTPSGREANEFVRKDSGCSVDDTSSSNISYYNLNKADQKHNSDVFLAGNFPPLPDVIEKPRAPTLSDGSSMSSARQANVYPSPKLSSREQRRPSIKNFDSRGDLVPLSQLSTANRSTKC